MTGRESHRILIFTIFTTLVITMFPSCNTSNIYSEVFTITDSSWPMYQKPLFRAPVSDTLSSFDILFTIRSTSDYPYRNIFLFVTTVSPEGYSIRDTVEYQLADDKGNWLGKGLGDIHDLSVPFKQNVIFPYSGTYKFEVQQGMRMETLPGIMDIGIRIRSHKPN